MTPVDLPPAEAEKFTPILRFFETHDVLRISDAREISGKAVSTTRHYLAALVDLGILIPHGTGKGTYYVMAEV